MNRFEPTKRTALDGKVWWVVWDNIEHRYSTNICFGKYRRKKDCQWVIDFFTERYGTILRRCTTTLD